MLSIGFCGPGIIRSVFIEVESLDPMAELYTDDDIRAFLREEMAKVGGLVKWANLNEIPISRVSEFHTGRRPASLTILIALGFTRTIVRCSDVPGKMPSAEPGEDL